MKITKAWLDKNSACLSGKEWVIQNHPNIKGLDLVKKLLDHNLSWAGWLIVRIMTYKQRVQYSVFAAEQVLDIFEKKYPKDDSPRKAIEAAKKCIDNPSRENKAASAAAYAAAAASAASAASSDAAYDYAAAYAAAAYAAAAASAAYDYAAASAAYDYAAAYAAASAAYAAASASAASASAASAASSDAAYASSSSARKNMQLKILSYGIELITKEE